MDKWGQGEASHENNFLKITPRISVIKCRGYFYVKIRRCFS
jgi:hypothetical protein